MIPLSNRDSQEVHRALRTYRACHIASLALVFAVKAVVVLLSALILLQLLFALIPWTLIPVLWDLSIGVVCLSIAGFILYKYLISKPPLLSIARILEKKAGFSRCLLLLALELELPGALGSPDLKIRAMCIARDQLAKLPRFVGQKPSRGLLTALAALSVAWILTTVTIKPGCAEYWKLPLSIGAKPRARIFPGSVCTPMHSSITIGCIPSAGTFPS
jgi:putative flippase GtrA